ncbi:MAG: ribonuclease, Rne/Rng family, partial [Solirubrobacterales bacterium]|nr:ribonuclease, Rne/Rng family [Solirubrobacterales bacterium]
MKKTILVSAERGETRVAVLESKTKGGKRDVAELYIERRGKRSIVGNIYKGKVDNVLPGMEAAFVDIGLERNGFLHVDEIVLPGGEQAPKRGRGSGRRINELIKPGQEILVQVVKDPLKTKGARLSMNVSIAGRYLVFAPQGSGVGVSRRLSDSERDRLRKMVDRTYKGPGGLIVRTAAHGAKKSDFVREIGYLQRLNEVLQRRSESTKAPALVFQEADLSVRVLRDVFLSEFERAIIDSEKQFERVTNFFQRTAPELVGGVELYTDPKPLLEKWKIDEEIESTLNRRVDLPSGGYLIIDYTEALTVIDVNSGSFTGRGKGGLEETITKVNTEAADEAVRQLRLRDIGGIIVIDFIDMARASNRDKVLKTMRKALDADKSKSYVVEVSPLGLVEMTRQNVTDGVREILTELCPTCHGEGVVLSAETVALEGLRKMREIAAEKSDEAFLVRVNPKVAAA